MDDTRKSFASRHFDGATGQVGRFSRCYQRILDSSNNPSSLPIPRCKILVHPETVYSTYFSKNKRNAPTDTIPIKRVRKSMENANNCYEVATVQLRFGNVFNKNINNGSHYCVSRFSHCFVANRTGGRNEINDSHDNPPY